ncbi:MAG: MipA/OmpV family protein [Burkholderiaceae bacterium]|nr:MipA/OmpV family protein [Burkholderiaceae bacterium]
MSMAAAPEARSDVATAPVAATTTHYVLGPIVGVGPDYAGGDGRSTSLRPAWAIEHGRFRLSTGRGSALMGYGLAQREEGASATLAATDGFLLSASLRLDNGRGGSDSPRLAGLPDIQRTLRGRLGASYALSRRWTVGAGVSQDLLDRGGGAQVSANLGYTLPITEQTRLVWGLGAGWGDGTYMRSHFGVPLSAAPLSPLPAYTPRAGFYSVDTGLELMTAINRHWVVWGALGVSQVQGEARRSPLTVQPIGYTASVGLAYRCCK